MKHPSVNFQIGYNNGFIAQPVMRMFLSVAIIVVFGAPARSQQAAPKAAVFTFGSSRDETLKGVGAPREWYVPESNSFLTSANEYLAALKVYKTDLEDVYMRETPTNAYRIKVRWTLDSTTSRLRPVERVYLLDVDIDKPGPAATILKDFAEAAEICKAGCDLYGMYGLSYHGVTSLNYPYVLAFPSSPTPAQLETGKLLAQLANRTTSAELTKGKTTAEWCVAIRLKLDPANAFERKPPDWNGKIDSFDIYPWSPDFLKDKTAKIGTWAP